MTLAPRIPHAATYSRPIVAYLVAVGARLDPFPAPKMRRKRVRSFRGGATGSDAFPSSIPTATGKPRRTCPVFGSGLSWSLSSLSVSLRLTGRGEATTDGARRTRERTADDATPGRRSPRQLGDTPSPTLNPSLSGLTTTRNGA